MTKVIMIFTDGSAHNNGEKKGIGGHGAVMIYDKMPPDNLLNTEFSEQSKILEIYGKGKNTTNQEQEILAVAKSLQRVKNSDIPVHVYSDSAYVVNCMNQKWYHGWRTNGWKNSKKEPVANQQAWEELLDAIESKWLDVTFHKVKGHAKIFYNEMADKLAGCGTSEVEKEMGF